jgi:hypothetical protein
MALAAVVPWAAWQEERSSTMVRRAWSIHYKVWTPVNDVYAATVYLPIVSFMQGADNFLQA